MNSNTNSGSGYILLVEDSEEDAEMTLRALKRSHVAIPIEWVTDGAEALDFLLKRGAFENRVGGNPMVILLDNKMPRLSGIETLAEIRATEDLKLLPIVMLTSSKQHTDILKSYNLGVNAYVIKPVTFEGFAEAVASIKLFWVLTNEPPPQRPETKK
jgi:CheY-like chemotaxis protein